MILTLPSNSSEAYYPNNMLTEFRTHLVQPLNFEISHEVALMEITLPTQWECLPKKQQIVIVALRSIYSLAEIEAQKNWLENNQKDLIPEPVTNLDWSKVIRERDTALPYKKDEYDGGRSITDRDNSAVIYNDNNFWNPKKKEAILKRIDNFVKNKQYNYHSMVKDVCSLANQKMLQWTAIELDYPLIFTNNADVLAYLNTLIATHVRKGHTFLKKQYQTSKKQIFSLTKGCDIVEIKPPKHCAIYLTPELSKVLGFENQYMFFWKAKSLLTMDVFGDIYSIYLYCDIIESRPVADQMAQLLRVIAIDRTGRSGFMQTVSFQHLEFFTMSANAINTVAVYLKDRAGRYIPFHRGEVTVSLLLQPKDI